MPTPPTLLQGRRTIFWEKELNRERVDQGLGEEAHDSQPPHFGHHDGPDQQMGHITNRWGTSPTDGARHQLTGHITN